MRMHRRCKMVRNKYYFDSKTNLCVLVRRGCENDYKIYFKHKFQCENECLDDYDYYGY